MTPHLAPPIEADDPDAMWADYRCCPPCDERDGLAIPKIDPALAVVRTRLRRKHDARLTWREQWTGAMAVVGVALLFVAALVVFQ